MENPIAKFDSVQFPVNEAAMTDQVSFWLTLFEVAVWSCPEIQHKSSFSQLELLWWSLFAEKVNRFPP